VFQILKPTAEAGDLLAFVDDDDDDEADDDEDVESMLCFL